MLELHFLCVEKLMSYQKVELLHRSDQQQLLRVEKQKKIGGNKSLHDIACK